MSSVLFHPLVLSNPLHRSTIESLEHLCAELPQKKLNTDFNNFQAIRDLVEPLWNAIEKFSRLLCQENHDVLRTEFRFNGLGSLKELLKRMNQLKNLNSHQQGECLAFATDSDRQYQRMVDARNSFAHGDSTPKMGSLDSALEFANWLLILAAPGGKSSASTTIASSAEEKANKNKSNRPNDSGLNDSMAKLKVDNNNNNKNNKAQSNKNDAINESSSAKCSYARSGKKCIEQNHYVCVTCDPQGQYTICEHCKDCHANHRLSKLRYGEMYCDCGADKHNNGTQQNHHHHNNHSSSSSSSQGNKKEKPSGEKENKSSSSGQGKSSSKTPATNDRAQFLLRCGHSGTYVRLINSGFMLVQESEIQPQNQQYLRHYFELKPLNPSNCQLLDSYGKPVMIDIMGNNQFIPITIDLQTGKLVAGDYGPAFLDDFSSSSRLIFSNPKLRILGSSTSSLTFQVVNRPARLSNED